MSLPIQSPQDPEGRKKPSSPAHLAEEQSPEQQEKHHFCEFLTKLEKKKDPWFEHFIQLFLLSHYSHSATHLKAEEIADIVCTFERSRYGSWEQSTASHRKMWEAVSLLLGGKRMKSSKESQDELERKDSIVVNWTLVAAGIFVILTAIAPAKFLLDHPILFAVVFFSIPLVRFGARAYLKEKHR